ncbi:hypothetical protein FACS189461_3280 [Spirochaetia bacterium]|nr:hypothetical protein FACS189461_3280 [Spirochaetia bacterium]
MSGTDVEKQDYDRVIADYGSAYACKWSQLCRGPADMMESTFNVNKKGGV